MIRNKKDLLFYLESDRKALKKEYKKPRFIHDIIWKYQILMRKAEYWQNCQNSIAGRIIEKIYKFRFVKLGQKLGFSIGLNTCGPGLAIVHYGLLVIHQNAKIGENCRIHEGVTIGSNASGKEAPVIGNNVYIASGAKVIGNISIADDVAIGAGAVVVKSVMEPGVTVAGVPARIISHNNSSKYIVKGTVGTINENYTN